MVSTRNPRYRKLKITSFEDINPLCNHHSYKPGHITVYVYVCIDHRQSECLNLIGC